MTEYFRFAAVRIVVCFVVVIVVVLLLLLLLLLSCFIFRLLSGIYAARLCISRYFAIFRLLFCLVFFADFFFLRAFLFFANLVAFLGILQLRGLLRRFTIFSLGFFIAIFFFFFCNLHSSEAKVDSHIKWLHVRMRHFCLWTNQYQR